MNSCVSVLAKLNLNYNYYIVLPEMDLKHLISTACVTTKAQQFLSLKVNTKKHLVDIQAFYGHLQLIVNIKKMIKHLCFQWLIKLNIFNTKIMIRLFVIIQAMDQYLEVDMIFISVIIQIRIIVVATLDVHINNQMVWNMVQINVDHTLQDHISLK